MTTQELTQPVSRLPGVGPKLLERLTKAGYGTLGELLQLTPRTYEDRITCRPLNQGAGPAPTRIITIIRVLHHDYFGPPHRQVLKIHIQDFTARASLVCFGRNFLAQTLTPGSIFYLSGVFTRRYGEIQSSDFETEPVDSRQLEQWKQHLQTTPDAPQLPPSRQFGRILPVYPGIAGLGQGQLRSILAAAVQHYGKHLTDPLPEDIRDQYNLMPYPMAIQYLHQSPSLEQARRALQRLAFQELLLLQLQLGKTARDRKKHHRNEPSLDQSPHSWTDLSAHPRIGPSISILPFQLTPDQVAVIHQILQDLQNQTAMARLLQGDVGSGKTLTAILCALEIVRQGRQVVFMAPTELLAKQHADTVHRYVAFQGVRAAFLSGSLTGKPREALLSALRTGEIDILVGTHAVFTQDVEFRDLGFAIIDEQHRFGVMQRQQLLSKGDFVHLLLMSATPIPRTLALTVYGDIEITTIRSKPAGRKPVETHLARMGNEQKVYEFVYREVSRGRQAYFVYPRIEDPADQTASSPPPPSETAEGPSLPKSSHTLNTPGPGSDAPSSDTPSPSPPLKSAEQMYALLSREHFAGYTVALLHGGMKEEEKHEIMTNFSMGSIQVLVATTVVEVGVDVANATCLVVEHAEAFGLSALHQLRGRVGRGTEQSYAFLVYQEPLTDIAKQRLKILKQTTDGFAIAEKDLELRGPGDLGGVQQSGFLHFVFADLTRDQELLSQTRQLADAILNQDPELSSPDHRALGMLLTLL